MHIFQTITILSKNNNDLPKIKNYIANLKLATNKAQEQDSVCV